MKKDVNSNDNKTKARTIPKELCDPAPQSTHSLNDQPLIPKGIRWTKFIKGDLVKVKAIAFMKPPRSPHSAVDRLGVVLEGYDSNVYEPASASVLVEDSIFHFTDREIELISPVGNDS